jgi:predicted RNA-binding Zn ribbon-like protein
MAQTDFRFDLGRPSLNFIATVGSRLGEQPIERLDSVHRLSEWIRLAGLLASGSREPKVTESDLDAAISLREALYRLVHDVVHGVAPRRDDLRLVNDMAAAADPPVPRLASRPGTSAWLATTTPVTAPQVLSLLARDAITMVGGPDLAFLHECEGNTCDGIFIDRSRGARRRWCSSRTCGNQARVEHFRAKTAGTP